MESKDFCDQLHSRLMRLSSEQIESIWTDFQKMHSPDEKDYRRYQSVFTMTLEEKKSLSVQADIVKLLERAEKAPGGAPPPPQGNENSQPTRRPVSSVL